MQTTRRDFLRRAGSVVTATSILPATNNLFARPTPKAPQNLRLGGPLFAKAEDPEDMARAHRQLGYRAAYCPGVALKDASRILALADAFAKHDVVIAEIGRWVNAVA